jgi:HEAT repeat protein
VRSDREHWSDTNAALRKLSFPPHDFDEDERSALLAGLRHEHPAVRRAAAETIAARPFTAALESLLAAAVDDNKHVRSAAVRALARLADDPDGRGWIGTWLAADDERKRFAAAFAVKDRRLLEHAADLERLAGDPAPQVRALVLSAPLSHGRRRSIEVFRPILDHVMPALADEVANVRLQAVHTASLLEPEQRAAVARRARTDADRRVRHAGLRLVEDPAAWLASLRDPTAAIRTDAARALAEAPDPDVTAALVRALTDRSLDVARAAANSLVKRDKAGAGPALIAALARARSPRRKATLADALGRLGDRSAVPAIAEALRAHAAPDPRSGSHAGGEARQAYELRGLATAALIRLGGPAAEAELAQLPRDYVRWIRDEIV